MKVILGLIIISLSFYISLEHLDQTVKDYWDLVAFALVIFGTLSVTIITMPSMKIKNLSILFLRGLKNNQSFREDCVMNAMHILRGNIPNGEATRLDQKILIDGIELIRLGFSSEKINKILIGRVEKYVDECNSIANWLKGLAKYPPAFGLAGTVLGLIHLMKSLGEGSDPKETGLKMAIALVATFYGIITSNILINPLGDRIANNTTEDVNLAEISINAILMLSEKTNYVEAMEIMNNFIPGQHRKIEFNNIMSEAS